MKRIILIVCLLVILLLGSCYQLFNEADVTNSNNFTSLNEDSEDLTVVLNDIFVYNKEAVAEELLDMRINNAFHSIKFSIPYPDEISFAVYTNPVTRFFHIKAFAFRCVLVNEEYKEYKIEMEE